MQSDREANAVADETFNPWWGDKAVAAAEAERLARQQDKREAEAFFNQEGNAVDAHTVTYGVAGATRVSTKTFDTREAAEAFAARWRASNSIGSYWAKVKS